MSLVGLDVEEKKSVNSFSLGMKRRLDIATALLGDTDVLIFDEPANGLDPLGIERRYEKAIGAASPAAQLLSAGSGCHNGL